MPLSMPLAMPYREFPSAVPSVLPVTLLLVPPGICELPYPPGVDAAVPGSLMLELPSPTLGVTLPGNLVGEPPRPGLPVVQSLSYLE